MNWRHLRTFAWLRWRLMVNQFRRAGRLNAVLLTAAAVVAMVAAVPLLVGGFALAAYAIPKATPSQLMYAWDGLIFAFLLFWCIGLVTELQRNDPLSLSKFLHLPVSVNGAFLINYLSSLVRLSLLFFGPLMAAYALALVYVQGLSQWAAPPSLAAFFLMVTAPTYQFQGWLASLMGNPRRRRAVVVGATFAFVLVFQLPNLINFYTPKLAARHADRAAARVAELTKLQDAFQAKEIDAKEFMRRQTEAVARHDAEAVRASREEGDRLERVVRIANTVVPAGWLPLGVMSAAEGRGLLALLGLAGMTLIGAASLWRAYRTTVRLFQGQTTNRKVREPAARAEGDREPRNRLLETRLPWLSEPVSAIALGGFRSLLRSPEAKMALLTPLIMGGVFGSLALQNRQSLPEMFRPLLGIAAIVFVLFGLLQLMGNQFGIDRDGFRVFVLCDAPRRDILLGKNLAYVPAAVVLTAALLTVLQVVCPMRVDHALSMVPQFVSMYLMFCALANLFSIYAPVYVPPGTLKPTNPKFTTVLLQLVLFLVLFPLCQGVTLLPLGAEAAWNALGWPPGVPVCLLLSLAECVAVALLYYVSLGWLGDELQAREQRILETVTNRAL